MRSLAAALGLAALIAPAWAVAAGASAAGKAPYPPEQQRRYELVVQKCSRCHSMELSLNRRYGAPEWRASLRRMVKLNGAGITAAQSNEIYEFLRFYAAQGK